MFLTDEERDARDNDSILVGVNTYGEDKLTGDLISCAVILDYKNLSQDLIDATIDGTPFTKEMDESLHKAVPVVYTFTMDALKLNYMSDMDTAIYFANYKAITGCVFTCFSKLSGDPDYILANRPIKEVIQNKELSLYTNKNNNSNFVVLDKWNQLRSLIPHTRFKQITDKEVFTLLFAKNFAKTIAQKSIAEQYEKYPEYTFDVTNLNAEQEKYLIEHGMTEYHRAFMPGMEKFAFHRNILI